MIPKTRPYLFPLKKTSKIDLAGRLGNYIGENKNNLIIHVRQNLKQMAENRDSLDFSRIQDFFDTDPSQLEQSEYYLINYLRFLYYFDNYFSPDFDNNKNIVSFPWTDSFLPSKNSKSLPHIKFELLCVLYNTAMIYLADGAYKIMVPLEEDVRNGIEKLSIALWALEDLKLILPFAQIGLQGIDDLNEEYIKFLIEYIQALIYSAWTLKLNEEIDYRYLAAAEINTSKMFKRAYDQFLSVINNPLPDKEFGKLKTKLYFNFLMHQAHAHYYMAVAIDINPNRTNDDKAVASEYLDRAITSTEMILQTKDDEVFGLEPEEAEEIFIFQDTLGKMIKKYPSNNKKNLEIPDFQDFFNVPRPHRPKDLSIKIPDDGKLESLLSPEVKAVKAAFDLQVTLEASGVESLLEKLRTVKAKKFSQSQVDSLASLEGQATSNSKVQIPDSLKKKVETFRKNGGYKGFINFRDTVAQLTEVCRSGINDLRNLVTKDKSEDEKLSKTFGDKYNPNLLCEDATKYLNNAKILEQKFLQAQESDSNFKKHCETCEHWMLQFTDSDEAILELILLNSDSQFLSKNQKLILEISKLNKDFLNEISLIPAKLKKINENFMRQDFLTSFVRIANNQVNQDDEFERLMTAFVNDLAEVKDKISEAYPKVDHIAGKATQMLSSGGKTPLKILTEMNDAIDKINKIYEDITTQTYVFYTELLNRINQMKEILPEALLTKNKARQKFLADNPYFQGSEFPMGQSVFMFKPPENKQEEQQGGMIESIVIQRASK